MPAVMEDELIRRNGFSISERPRYGPAIWVRGGKSFTHEQALRIAIREEKKKRERDDSLKGGI